MIDQLRFLASTALFAGLLSFPVFGAPAISSNSQWFARVWQTEEGLPDNTVTGVIQSPEGYLWIATHGGLARFDGTKFRRIPLPMGEFGLPRRMIRASLGTGGHAVWLALEGGVAVAISRDATNVFTGADGLPNIRPLCLAQSSDGAIWIGYASGTAYRIKQGRVKRFTDRDGLIGVGGCWLTADTAGRLWFARAGNVGVLEGERFKRLLTLNEQPVRIGISRAGGLWVCAGASLYKYQEGHGLKELGHLESVRAGTEVTVLFEDRSGALWIGTLASGLFRYADSTFEKVETSHEEILSITEDYEGNIWVGTGGGGLNRLRPRVLALQGTESGLPSRVVRSLCEDSSGKIWATEQNGALVRRDGKRWSMVSKDEGWAGGQATCVTADRTGTVWIGTFRRGLFRWRDGKFARLTEKSGLLDEGVRALAVDSKGGLWIGWESGKCVQHLAGDIPETLPLPLGSRPVRAIAEDTDGNMWFGTSSGMLLRWDGKNLVDETARTLPTALPIRCLEATPDGSVWIGYAVAGLGRMRNGRFARIGTEQGLPDDYISQIIPDGHGWFWLAGNHGIFQVRQRELDQIAEGQPSQLLIRPYGKDDGLPNLQASYGYAPGALRSRDGNIWIPMLTGLAIVHPSRVNLSQAHAPILVDRFKIDGLAYVVSDRAASTPASLRPGATTSEPSGSLLRLAPGHRRVEFDFTSPSFIAPENIKFRYRLDGLDEDWVEGGNQRVASYSRLPAGKYRFRVTACNNYGIWNTNEASLSFVVLPFFWQRWWFRIGVGGLLLVALAGAVRTVERQRLRRRVEFLEHQHAIERERIRIAQDIHDDLGAGLTQIGLLADLGASNNTDQEQVRRNFEKIEGRARRALTSLDEIVWAVNPRNDNLPRLADYLCRVADECFEAGAIRCRKDVPTGLPPVPVATELRHNLALAVKEALANALKHSAARTAWLRLKWNAPELNVIVEDDGAGFEVDRSRSSDSNGLSNQKNRMKDIDGAVEIVSVPGQGTRVEFRVRLTERGPVTAGASDSNEPG